MNQQGLRANQSERPIVSTKQDQLYRQKFIKQITRAIINPESKNSTGVVIGIAGPWGSGKTSILNLLEEEIRTQYDTQLVVRFDPWLISGRDSMINQFFAELLGSINKDKKLSDHLSGIATLIADYGTSLAPLLDYALPGLSKLLTSGTGALKTALSKRGSLHNIKKKLFDALKEVDVPIVVMIDELDRIEDEEVRAVAQLVRAVADFPNISYVLAYDPDRVIQALGRGANGDEQKAHGRAYLEKIVQFQIPLPVTLADELTGLLVAELAGLGTEFSSSATWDKSEDFLELLKTTIPDLISTPRDIKRLVGTFHVLEGMVHGEVNWVDLLGYCVLLVKTPSTAERIKCKPDTVVENPITMEEEYWRFGSEKLSADERLNKFIPEVDRNANVRGLLRFLFPTFIDDASGAVAHVLNRVRSGSSDFICYRQHLLTVLRHDILPGTFSRSEVTAYLTQSSMQLPRLLQEVQVSGKFGDFLNRLEDVYSQTDGISHGEFWLGVGTFLRRTEHDWIKTYSPMQEISLALGRLFIRMSSELKSCRDSANEIIVRLDSMGDMTFTPQILRSHVHMYGLFGWKKRESEKPFLSEETVLSLIKSQSVTLRENHLHGNLFPRLWHLSAVYNMIDVGAWDVACSSRLDSLLESPEALDGFTLLTYGGAFSTDSKDLSRMLNRDLYLERVRSRLENISIDGTVAAALRKAMGD